MEETDRQRDITCSMAPFLIQGLVFPVTLKKFWLRESVKSVYETWWISSDFFLSYNIGPIKNTFKSWSQKCMIKMLSFKFSKIDISTKEFGNES